MTRRQAVHRSSRSIRTFTPKSGIPVTLYDTALAEMAYGNTQLMGDLFGDIMGAVVGKENWDARPAWMKNVRVKPNPTTIFQQAAKIVPPKAVGSIVRQAEQHGFNMYYRTPAGEMPVTAETAESIYGNYPAFLRAKETFGAIPLWVYLAGGIGLLLLFMKRKK